MQTRSQKLLSCPFCGKEAEMIEEPPGTFKVQCKFIGACYGNWRPGYATIGAAISRWNLRPVK